MKSQEIPHLRQMLKGWRRHTTREDRARSFQKQPQDRHTAELSPQSQSRLGTHGPVWVLSSSSCKTSNSQPSLEEEGTRNRPQATKSKTDWSAPGKFRSSRCFPRVTIKFPEDRQPPEAGWRKRWAMLLRLSGRRDCTSFRYGIYPRSRTGRRIRNSVKRGREQGQEIIDTKQTALGIKPLQLAGLLHISRILFFFSPCLIKKEPIYKGKEFQTVIIS